MQLNGPWTRDETSAVGQVFEFRLWALLAEQSRGGLHVFLPLADRGVDALVHRINDGTYFQVQAKSRSTLQDGEVHLVVLPETLAHDEVLIVAGLVVEGGVGPTLLVAPAADFRRLADLTSDEGKPVYSAEFGMRPRSDTRWLPWLVPIERLGERFGAPLDRVEEALKVEQMILDEYANVMDSRLRSFYLQTIGGKLARIGCTEAARAQMRQAIRLNPANIRAYVQYALSFGGSPIYRRAHSVYRRWF